MLKLRKNKKGFTLVELIVVIAIMAVLAGTIAGVTVSQLNKQTDNANKTQAKKIADTIYTELLENPDIKFADTKDNNGKVTANGMETELTTAYGDIVKCQTGDTAVTATKGKEFKVTYTTEGKDTTDTTKVTAYAYYTVEYKGKQSGGKGDVTYFISAENGVQDTADKAKAI